MPPLQRTVYLPSFETTFGSNRPSMAAGNSATLAIAAMFVGVAVGQGGGA